MDGMDSRRSVSVLAGVESDSFQSGHGQEPPTDTPQDRKNVNTQPTVMVLGFLFGSCIGLMVSGMETRRLLAALAAWQTGPTVPDAFEQHWRLATVLMW